MLVIGALFLGLFRLEYDAEGAVGETGAGDAEGAYLTCRCHVLSDAGTDVVVAYAHQPERLAGILGQPVELHSLGNLVAGDKLVVHRQVLADEFVHPSFHLGNLPGCGAGAEVVVDFRFLPLDMGVP